MIIENTNGYPILFHCLILSGDHLFALLDDIINYKYNDTKIIESLPH